MKKRCRDSRKLFYQHVRSSKKRISPSSCIAIDIDQSPEYLFRWLSHFHQALDGLQTDLLIGIIEMVLQDGERFRWPLAELHQPESGAMLYQRIAFVEGS